MAPSLPGGPTSPEFRDTGAYWCVRGAAYLALLGIWLPETAAAREAWLRRRYTEDAKWATRVDLAMISRFERESS